MSTQAVRVRTGITPSQVALSAVAATKIFAINDLQSGDTGVITFRELKNADAAITIYIGGVGVTAATGYPVLPGGSFEPLGPSGSGYCGDVYAIAASGTPTVGLIQW